MRLFLSHALRCKKLTSVCGRNSLHAFFHSTYSFLQVSFCKNRTQPGYGKQKQMHSFYITPVRHYFLVTKLVLFCGLPQFLRIKKIFISIKTRLDACSQNALRKQRYCAVLPCADPSRNVDWCKCVCIAQSSRAQSHSVMLIGVNMCVLRRATLLSALPSRTIFVFAASFCEPFPRRHS